MNTKQTTSGQQPISVAVIGAGMAGRTHANAYRQASTVFGLDLPPIRLHTIADIHLPAAEDAAKRYGYENATADWCQVIDDPEIDAVSIVVGNALHRPIAEAALAAGKHALCEKPLSDTIADARAMAELEKTTDLVTAVGYCYRRNPGIAALIDTVQDGRIGKVAQITAEYLCDYGADPLVPMSWRYQGPQGSGALGDLGVHLLDTLEQIAGRIIRVGGASFANTVTERPVATANVAGGRGVTGSDDAPKEPVENEDTAVFTADFASGARGMISTSRVAFGLANGLKISVAGPSGRAGFDMAQPAAFWMHDPQPEYGTNGPRNILVGPKHRYVTAGSAMDFEGVGFSQVDQFIFQNRAFLEQIVAQRTGEPFPNALPTCPTFADGVHTMLVLDAVARSAAAGGTTVKVEQN
ncbi:Gfo/Idh/MocA family oxidoreductase [Helcobacillus massiliensis]|uniref:Gfo/Idh/MocA family protein n=1 Tax=Helcobacillus massiliensis TaxID=521392 RepID=UPI0021A54E87|nr:Gfo/Idh/MocA family oxidoreductase [Helcobacillus massiliensis]MCT1557563.1 Gfo/Idh/MocA family oxidoreductase [Helcobacillus massiliensis]MCT2036788.1 Gfo/Idh/MocA family oxidoreductase [Helcobacillus massiliensis]MCT2332459.1 Gfo/Idh/MocA family oxidoreductase [Helcobacillus massiliensis]